MVIRPSPINWLATHAISGIGDDAAPLNLAEHGLPQDHE
jgi:hypothetical protein